jgi:hypothetical protein
MFVAAHSLPVKRREYQFAALGVLFAVEAERRSRAEYVPEVGRAFDQIAARAEYVLDPMPLTLASLQVSALCVESCCGGAHSIDAECVD